MTEDIALEFLDQVYRDVDGGWLSLFYIRRLGENATSQGILWHSLEEHYLTALAASELTDACVWLGAATRREDLGPTRRGGVADCETLPALWVDIDIAGPGHKVAEGLPANFHEAFDLLAACPLVPTCTVNTGGGLQGWWLFNEPIDADDYAADLLARWGVRWFQVAAERGLRVDSVFNVDRILRLPGTNNLKVPDNPRPVEIVNLSTDWDRRYGLDDFEEWAVSELTPVVPVEVREPYTGAERPGDKFNREHSPVDVLVRAGFKIERIAHGTGEAHLTGPWKDKGVSASVYQDGHATIWSDSALPLWPALELRRPYDAFGLYAAIEHGGDHGAAARALNPGVSTLDLSLIQGNGAKAEVGEAEVRDSVFLDWGRFWDHDRSEAEWLYEPILARGRAHAIFATHKVGKSLVMLWVAGRLVTSGEPVRVIYLDFEMTEDDLYERLSDMGYGPDTDLGRLHYALLPPSLDSLDTKTGANELLALVDAVREEHPDDHLVVIIDTLSRAVVGEENNADTVRSFYRHTGMRLKERQLTWVRIDHAGKDASKGQRGSSAKGDDVDVVWRILPADDGLTMRREMTRMSWVPDSVPLRRLDDPLRYVVEQGMWPEGTKEVADILDSLGVSPGASQREAQRAFSAAGHHRRATIIRAAQRFRSQMLPAELS